MNEYYQKYYKGVPLAIRRSISSDEHMELLDEMTKKYDLNLAMFVIRVMIRDVELARIEDVLVNEFAFEQDEAEELKNELMEKIFAPVMDYLKGEGGEERIKGDEQGEEQVEEEEKELGMDESLQPTEIIEPRSTGTQDVGTQDFESLPQQAPDAKTAAEDEEPITDADAGLEIEADPPIIVEAGGSVPEGLSQEYSKFAKSSVYVNAQEFANGLMDKKLTEIKEVFYKAINAREVFKVIGGLMIISRRGVLRHAFEKDERYAGFWKRQLVDTGAETKNFASLQGGNKIENFLKDPAREKYLISFFRFILEKKCGLSENESAIVGVILGALAREAGELEYQDLAYGDEEIMKYRWRG